MWANQQDNVRLNPMMAAWCHTYPAVHPHGESRFLLPPSPGDGSQSLIRLTSMDLTVETPPIKKPRIREASMNTFDIEAGVALRWQKAAMGEYLQNLSVQDELR